MDNIENYNNYQKEKQSVSTFVFRLVLVMAVFFGTIYFTTAGNYQYTTPPLCKFEANGTYYCGNTSINGTEISADAFSTSQGGSGPYSYLIYTDGVTVYAKDGRTGKVFSGTDAALVYNSTVGSNRRIVFAPGTYNWNTVITIPNQTWWMETEGLGYVQLKTGVPISDMITLGGGYTGASVSGYKRNYKLSFRNIRFDCNNQATVGLNLSQPEQSLSTLVDYVESNGCITAINLDGNEDSSLRNSVIHKGNVSAKVPFGMILIDNTYIGNDGEYLFIGGQTINIANSILYNVTVNTDGCCSRPDVVSMSNTYFNLAATPPTIDISGITLSSLTLKDVFTHGTAKSPFIITTNGGTITTLSLNGGNTLSSVDASSVEFFNASISAIYGSSPTFANGAVLGNTTITNIVHGMIQTNWNRIDIFPSTSASDILWVRQNGNESRMYMGYGNRSDGSPYVRMRSTYFETDVQIPGQAPTITPSNGSLFWNGSYLCIYSDATTKKCAQFTTTV